MKTKQLLLLALAMALSLTGAKAITFTTNTTIGVGDPTYDGQPIGVSNCTLTVNGPHSFAILLLTNGVYSLTGGYWALPTAVQTTSAPTLAIIPAAPGWAAISWTPPTLGFVLQETTSLSPSNWTNSPSDATNPITVPAVPPSKSYRLNKP